MSPATIRWPVVEVQATVSVFENGNGFTLNAHPIGKLLHAKALFGKRKKKFPTALANIPQVKLSRALIQIKLRNAKFSFLNHARAICRS